MVVGPIDVSQVQPPDDLRSALTRDEATPIFNDVLGQWSKRKLKRICTGWPARAESTPTDSSDDKDGGEDKDVTAEE